MLDAEAHAYLYAEFANDLDADALDADYWAAEARRAAYAKSQLAPTYLQNWDRAIYGTGEQQFYEHDPEFARDEYIRESFEHTGGFEAVNAKFGENLHYVPYDSLYMIGLGREYEEHQARWLQAAGKQNLYPYRPHRHSLIKYRDVYGNRVYKRYPK